MRKSTEPIFLLLVLATFGLYACTPEDAADDMAQSEKDEVAEAPAVTEDTRKPTPCESLTLDDFAAGLGKMYRPFGRETTLSQSGYGIYYVEATVNVSLVKAGGKSTGVRIEYTLPPHFSWGNWASVRKEFDSITDVSDCDGIEIGIQLGRTSGADLRLTLADVANPGDADRHGADELWWFDMPNSSLGPAGELITVKAPFNSFSIGYGDGVRINNRQLDLSNVVAYELNVISGPGNTETGSLLIGAIRGYKN